MPLRVRVCVVGGGCTAWATAAESRNTDKPSMAAVIIRRLMVGKVMVGVSLLCAWCAWCAWVSCGGIV